MCVFQQKERILTHMTKSHEELARRIWIKCEQEHWFGGELRRGMHPEEDPRGYGFAFPSVSEERIQDAERNLGFPLPPFLRYLYTHMANGGFGPGLGLYKISSCPGSDYNCNKHLDRSIVGYYRFRTREQVIDLTEYPSEDLEEIGQKFWRFPLGTWPRYMLLLGDMGCSQMACVNKDNQMFLECAIEEDDMYGLFQLGCTFEEWIERWLNDKPTIW
jgi:hypothetical protein